MLPRKQYHNKLSQILFCYEIKLMKYDVCGMIFKVIFSKGFTISNQVTLRTIDSQ